jgi:5-formyltetrahydrofolate cyclo-ligase
VTADGGTGDAKRQLRARMRDVRAAVAADLAGRARRSASICAAVGAEIAARPAAGRPVRAMLFEALPGEPDLTPLTAWCGDNGVDTFLPEVDGDALVVMPGDLDPAALDVVVVPGLAFTPWGDRLGQGGGHYDRFLARLRPGCLVVGVAFHEQLVEQLPSSDHDVAVDVVIVDR